MQTDEPGPAVAVEIAHHVMPDADTPPAADVDPAPPDGVALAWHCHRCGRALGRVWAGRLHLFRDAIPPRALLSAGRVVAIVAAREHITVLCECGERKRWGH